MSKEKGQQVMEHNWFPLEFQSSDGKDKHMPNTQIKIKGNRIPYVNSDVKEIIRQRDYLRAKANKMGSNILRQAYYHLRNKVNYTLTQLRKNYYTDKIEENKDNLKKT